MTVFAYLVMLTGTLALAGVFDWAWLRFLRPILAKSYGWPEVDDSERIPAVAWVGAAAVLSIMFIFLPLVGVAAGY